MFIACSLTHALEPAEYITSHCSAQKPVSVGVAAPVQDTLSAFARGLIPNIRASRLGKL